MAWTNAVTCGQGEYNIESNFLFLFPFFLILVRLAYKLVILVEADVLSFLPLPLSGSRSAGVSLPWTNATTCEQEWNYNIESIFFSSSCLLFLILLVRGAHKPIIIVEAKNVLTFSSPLPCPALVQPAVSLPWTNAATKTQHREHFSVLVSFLPHPHQRSSDSSSSKPKMSWPSPCLALVRLSFSRG